MTEVKGPARYSPPPKITSPCLWSCAIFAPMWYAFKMQPELHNSADHGISKFVYLRHCLVVCFYPRPSAWPWSWDHMYRHLACVECYCFLNGNFEVSSHPSKSIVADLIRGCTVYLEVRSWSNRSFQISCCRSDLRVHHLSRGQELIEQALKNVEIIGRSLLEDPLVARH